MTTHAVWFSQQTCEVLPGRAEVTTLMGKDCAPAVWLFTQSSKPEPLTPHICSVRPTYCLSDLSSLWPLITLHCFLPAFFQEIIKFLLKKKKVQLQGVNPDKSSLAGMSPNTGLKISVVSWVPEYQNLEGGVYLCLSNGGMGLER